MPISRHAPEHVFIVEQRYIKYRAFSAWLLCEFTGDEKTSSSKQTPRSATDCQGPEFETKIETNTTIFGLETDLDTTILVWSRHHTPAVNNILYGTQVQRGRRWI